VSDVAKARILIAEDSLAAARVLQFRLESAGLSVDAARNGREALEKALRTQFDLVVTDEQMPSMSGRELCRELRSIERYARTPIILLTAKRFELDLNELKRDLGICAVFGKPFSPESLLRTIEGQLGISSMTTELSERYSARGVKKVSPGVTATRITTWKFGDDWISGDIGS
jgi:CheY-like chemotaxis protein